MPINYISSWDDATAGDMRIAELMAKYKLKTTFYWPVNWQKHNATKGRATINLDQAKSIATEFEIGSHGVNHELLTRVPLDVAYREIADSKIALEELFGKPIKSFCYPRGYFDDDIKSYVAFCGYDNARTTRVGNLDPGDPFETDTTVHVGYDRKEYGGLSWLEYARAKLLDAVTRAAEGDEVTYHMWGHSWELDKYNGWDELTELLDQIGEIGDIPSQ